MPQADQQIQQLQQEDQQPLLSLMHSRLEIIKKQIAAICVEASAADPAAAAIGTAAGVAHTSA